MVTYAGQGDPRRTMELLWGLPLATEATPRGPKPAFTVDDIVAAATDIPDTEGFDAVSMRSVGERLGRSAMALYTYVPSKAELVDLMLDRALRELDVTYDVADGGGAAPRPWLGPGAVGLLPAASLGAPDLVGASRPRSGQLRHDGAPRGALRVHRP